MFICCGTGWRRIVCVLDNINHTLPRPLGRIQRLCDWHDRIITQGYMKCSS